MLGLVFLLITVRQIGRFTFRIWQVMTVGAVLVLLTGEISLPKAISAINPDVMVFLFGMFVVGEAVSTSGLLAGVSDYICKVARTRDQLLLIFITVMAVSSAFLINDTVAIIGTPLALSLAYRYRIPPAAVLLVLCFSLTTGSVPSPIGNPQNFLVASYWNPPDPFLSFATGLFVPTLISLGLIVLLMRTRWMKYDNGSFHPPDLPASPDRNLVRVTILSLLILATLILIRIGCSILGKPSVFPLGVIALSAALPVLLLAKQRVVIIRQIDWRTLVFFVAMFVLMQSVYDSGWFQTSIPFTNLTTIPLILMVSIILSQLISNVPFIALFQPVIAVSGMSSGYMLALAAGSTIAGNLTILGAASNVIVIQQAEKAGVSIRFSDFIRIGLPLTLLQAIIYTLWLFYFT
ncbi:ArsB/NhaD family transporter [Methanospirillum lacunae]